ncbi:uncharacterized protein CC84DRAFT_1166865 [Paraphaeosphaeria sporulosa]|uniref:Uncharacterized protein n=1 Tax=Paraphaeosphaeria sporulosa TaxID=1460663 RepID=A0A177C8C6_9PLEO|nr:uncharacterized protein CC84DRAFT_1166865 [Paraphaeosphaeria sporulosa]OAG03112.1 hypothetical protein CC84DRAFT_1166865 [Paraphaeosphaeria sporulosa]
MDYTTLLRHLCYTALIELYPACGRLRVIYLSLTIFASTSHLSLLPLTSTSYFYLLLLPLTSTSYFYLLLLPPTNRCLSSHLYIRLYLSYYHQTIRGTWSNG